jgi:uncharacterized protein (DUF2384 family)
LGDTFWTAFGLILFVIAPLFAIVTLVYCLVSLPARNREFNARMAELDVLERKQFVRGRLTEEEKARLWDLGTIRNQAEARVQGGKELMAYLAWSKYMNDNK